MVAAAIGKSIARNKPKRDIVRWINAIQDSRILIKGSKAHVPLEWPKCSNDCTQSNIVAIPPAEREIWIPINLGERGQLPQNGRRLCEWPAWNGGGTFWGVTLR